MLVGEILKSVTGDDGYPGDTSHLRALAGDRARHARDPQRALAQVLQLGRHRGARPEAADPVDARRAGHRRRRRLAVGAGHARLARRGPGLAGRGRVRTAADGGADPRGPGGLRGARRPRRDRVVRGVRPLPAARLAASAGTRASSASWSRFDVRRSGARADRSRADGPARPRRPERRADHGLRARGRRAGGREKPFLVYLQGGPGFEAPRPTGSPRGPAWLDRALQDFRVLLLDQRGTGRSTPVHGTESAEYLTHFRADSIVRDAELLRAALDSPPWSVLGQSFGGLCVFSYLSFAPDGLREAFVTGGVPGIGVPRRRRLPRDLRADDRAQPPLLRALPGRPRARAGADRCTSTATTCGCPTATR